MIQRANNDLKLRELLIRARQKGITQPAKALPFT